MANEMDMNLGEAMRLDELDYWPPHDEDVNYIRISLLMLYYAGTFLSVE